LQRPLGSRARPRDLADLLVFDPRTVGPVTEDVVRDFPKNGWRMRRLRHANKVCYASLVGRRSLAQK
jgi:hypothetical protein